MTLRFDKYEGLGNDFLVVEGEADDFSEARVARLCDRHFGVGGDGVLVVSRAGDKPRMVVKNADGSRPEMCGNGLRCVAMHLARTSGERDLVVATDAGDRACVLEGETVAIDMGRGVLGDPVELDLGRPLHFRRVSMGNPHAVTFDPVTDDEFRRWGLALATHPAFPEGANVEMVDVRGPKELVVRVWERGVGPTLACGTGACAVAVAAAVEGRAPFDEEITVRLPGGPLAIAVAKDLRVRMRGPARRVFSGEVDG